jgi:hypothetical protein
MIDRAKDKALKPHGLGAFLFAARFRVISGRAFYFWRTNR